MYQNYNNIIIKTQYILYSVIWYNIINIALFVTYWLAMIYYPVMISPRRHVPSDVIRCHTDLFDIRDRLDRRTRADRSRVPAMRHEARGEHRVNVAGRGRGRLAGQSRDRSTDVLLLAARRRRHRALRRDARPRRRRRRRRRRRAGREVAPIVGRFPVARRRQYASSSLSLGECDFRGARSCRVRVSPSPRDSE